MEQTPHGLAILADSAFLRLGGGLEGKIVRARKQNEMGPNSDVPRSSYLGAVDTLRERAMPSERQSAEWGVRAMKGPFKRLTVPLPPDARERKRVISTCVHLYNFRTRLVGLNQIRTVYASSKANPKPWIRDLVQVYDNE